MIYLDTRADEMDFPGALSRVSAQRREYALRYLRESDRRLSLAVYILLQEALEKEYGIVGAPEFGFGPHGKPYLVDFPGIHFNLSHCHGAALCVVDNVPVGCDIEAVEDSLDMDLCRHCCNDDELGSILRAPNPPLAFCELWTRKEAFLKYTGEGLCDNLPSLMLSPRAARARFETHVAPDLSFVYTICRE